MGFFDRFRDQAPSGMLPSGSLELLADFGRFSDPRVLPKDTEQSSRMYEALVGPACMASTSDRARTFSEICDAGGAGDDWTAYGAHRLITEIDPTIRDPAYLAILDRALRHMRSEGFSLQDLNRYEFDRWMETGGTKEDFLGVASQVSPSSIGPA